MSCKIRHTVALDLDGTLATYHGWTGLEGIGDPRPGAKDFAWALYKDYELVVNTARVSAWQGRDVAYAARVVRDWLGRHGFPPCEVWDKPGKPMALFYVDDRGVTIRENPGPDDFAEVLARIRTTRS